MTVNALSIDVEDYYQVENFKHLIPEHDWVNCESRVEANTSTILQILDTFQVRATFFVLGWLAERHGGLVQLIHKQGHEVASHGYGHNLIYNSKPEHFRDDVSKSKKILEDLTGDCVLGYRAPSYSITRRSLWAIDILIEAGFKYDSSIFPIIHDRYGIPSAQRFPHKLRGCDGQCLEEFPPTTFKLFGITVPVSGGGYFRFFPYSLTKWAFKWINHREQKPFIFYLHPWEFDPGQPRIKTDMLRHIRHYCNIEKTEVRFKKLLSDFKFDTVKRILQLESMSCQ